MKQSSDGGTLAATGLFDAAVIRTVPLPIIIVALARRPHGFPRHDDLSSAPAALAGNRVERRRADMPPMPPAFVS
jgi:hypothetical protein